jgi:type IV pilus assembly protein PilB
LFYDGHANNVIDVIGRFLNMNVDLYNFVAALNCVLAQRLVRKLCATCKRHYQPTDEEIPNRSETRSRDQHEFYMSVGCDACNHTGYRGRTAIHELLDMSDKIREMIVERRPGSEIRREAEKKACRVCVFRAQKGL